MALVDSKKNIKRKIRKTRKPKPAIGDMSLTDKDIDTLYSASAEGLSLEYKESYWEEFNSQLSSAMGQPCLGQ